MAYIRYGSKRKYIDGKSNSYIYPSVDEYIYWNGMEIEPEDVFEFIMRMLQWSEINITEEQKENLKKQLYIGSD